jgi:acyl carrier protein
MVEFPDVRRGRKSMAAPKLKATSRAKLLKELTPILALNSRVAKEEDITESASLVDDLGFDALDHIELAMELEEEFKLGDGAITDEDMDEEAVKTVADVLAMLERKLAK